MADDTPYGADTLLEEVLGERRRTATYHRFRAGVLEQGTRLELAVDEVLAASTARTAGLAEQLRADVMWRLPVPVRLSLLNDLLERKDLVDRFPFISPVLRKFFDLRHLLAHGFALPMDLEEKVLRVATIKKGRPQTVSFSLPHVAWLIREASQVQIELVTAVWAAVVPADEGWHED